VKKKDPSKQRKGGSILRKRLRLNDPSEPSITLKSPARVKIRKSDESQPTRNVIDIIRQIKANGLDPNDLSKIERRRCVQHLSGEGLSVPEIAQVMGVSDRTVARDRKAIHEEEALEHDPHLASLMAGRLVSEAELVIQRIRRVSRDRETPHAVRVEAEKSCYMILVSMTDRLQSLGYLPTAAQRIEADVRHESAAVPSHKEISVEIERLETIAEETGDGHVVKTLKKLRSTATRARLVERMCDVETCLSTGGRDNAA